MLKKYVFLVFGVFVTDALHTSDWGRRKSSLFYTPARSFVENALNRGEARGSCPVLNRFARNHNFSLTGPSGRVSRGRAFCIRKDGTVPRGASLFSGARRTFPPASLGEYKTRAFGREAPREISWPDT